MQGTFEVERGLTGFWWSMTIQHLGQTFTCTQYSPHTYRSDLSALMQMRMKLLMEQCMNRIIRCEPDNRLAHGLVIDNKNGFVALFTDDKLHITRPTEPPEWPVK